MNRPSPLSFGSIPRPAFGSARQHLDAPAGAAPRLTTKADRRYMRAATLAAELLPVLPEPGETVHTIMLGTFDLCQVIGPVACPLALVFLCVCRQEPLHSAVMSDVTRLLDAAQAGDRQATADLLPLVYDELRKLAAARMAAEAPGHTLDATALVHEAYLRLVGGENRPTWGHRRQFVAAAAEAMRRILIDHARRVRADKRGGERDRVPLDDLPSPPADPTDWVQVDAALDRLAALDPGAAELVRLKVFGGASVEDAAELLGVSRATAYRDWAFARAWLRDTLGRAEQKSGKS